MRKFLRYSGRFIAWLGGGMVRLGRWMDDEATLPPVAPK